ncbi:MAG: hypothetical protein G01um101416_822 [Microgenomates group bacterium Gr01-1014_16]|nr:MAG: hypothetical protein G01um101416_822 [Microgenomates group bacterium Gr01-1014_16]
MKHGFVATTTVLIISAVIVAVVTTTVLLSVGEGQAALALLKGEENLANVEGCVEDVLQKIHDSGTYSGTSIGRPEGTCTISYTLGGPTNWDITVSFSGTEYNRKIRVVFTRGAAITILRWEEEPLPTPTPCEPFC